MSDHFVSIQTKNKLRLVPNRVMSSYFRRDIAIDFDDFKESILGGKGVELLVGYFALRVPACSEVDKRMCEFVLEKVVIEFL